jgi:hypothetical protein
LDATLAVLVVETEDAVAAVGVRRVLPHLGGPASAGAPLAAPLLEPEEPESCVTAAPELASGVAIAPAVLSATSAASSEGAGEPAVSPDAPIAPVELPDAVIIASKENPDTGSAVEASSSDDPVAAPEEESRDPEAPP